MDKIKLAGFKEVLEKDAAVTSVVRAGARGGSKAGSKYTKKVKELGSKGRKWVKENPIPVAIAGGAAIGAGGNELGNRLKTAKVNNKKLDEIISKLKSVMDDARVGYHGGRSDVGWVPRDTKAGRTGQFVGKNRNSIAGGTGAAGVAGGGAVAYSKKKEASLSKEAGWRMSKAFSSLKDVATARQAREGMAHGKRVADQVRKGGPAGGLNATRAQALGNAQANVLKGGAKTTALYGGGAAAGTAAINSQREKKAASNEQPGYFGRQAAGARAITGGGVLRTKDDIKDNLNIAATHTLPTAASGVAGGALINKYLLGGKGRTGALVGGLIGSTLGSVSGAGAIMEKDHQKLKSMGFENSRLTGVKKVPKKYLKE